MTSSRFFDLRTGGVLRRWHAKPLRHETPPKVGDVISPSQSIPKREGRGEMTHETEATHEHE